MKILVLCTGNSCRSQMAYGFLKSFDSSLEVHSGGTNPAERVNPKAVEVMKEVGIDITANTPHNVSEFINEPWDYVITVCGGANENCPVFSGQVKHRLHIGFDDPSDAKGSDDYVMSEFRRVRDEIQKQFMEFYNEEIRKQ